MTQVVRIKCDGPKCSNSIEAHTDDGLLRTLNRTSCTWYTLTDHGQYPATYHFCSSLCLRNAAQRRVENKVLGGETDEG